MTSQYRRYLAERESAYYTSLGAFEELSASISAYENSVLALQKESGEAIAALDLLSKVSKISRGVAKTHLENIVTEALQYISEDDYRFVIELGESGGKPTCEFYVESDVNGEVSRQRPEHSCGGGFVDIISAALRYAYIELHSDPAILNKAIILDEPGKMISEQASEKFANFVKYLGQTYNKQTIMVTHNDIFMTDADKTFQVSKVGHESVVQKGHKLI